MRDAARIDRLLKKLRIIWYVWQDQRLGQLVHSLHIPMARLTGTHIFHIDDDEWEGMLDKILFDWDNGLESERWNKNTCRLEPIILFRDRIWLVTKDELYED